MSTTLLLDADVPAYKFASSNQDTFDWGDSVSLMTDEDRAKDQIRGYIDDLMEDLKADHMIVCLSDDFSNFRKGVLPTYKGNRKKEGRPELLYPLKEWMFETYESRRREHLEGDDVLGILSTHPKLIKGKKIIVSIDKDLQTIPGWLFNPDKDKRPRLIPEIEADRFWMYQTLIGDTTDHYKGCPFVGPVKAERALADCDTLEEMWEAVVAEFEKKKLTAEDALVQARVARILRWTDYDFKKREVKLWEPPTL